MTDNKRGIEQVRAVMDDPEEVPPMDGLAQPAGDDPIDGSPPPPGPESPEGEGDDPPERICSSFPLNDYGNGKRLAVHFGADIIWVPRVGWFTWDGRRWAVDADRIAVRRMAQQLGQLIERELPHLVLEPWQMAALAEEQGLRRRVSELLQQIEADGDDVEILRQEMRAAELRLSEIAGLSKILTSKRKDHRGFARTSGNTARIEALMIESSVSLARALDDLDASALDVNCQTGVMRFSVVGGAGDGFSRTADMSVIDHDRAHLITKMMPVDHDPEAKAPMFEAFLGRIQPDPEIRAFLQRWFGLSMTALTGEQKLVFLHGMGANGKSVLVDLMARMMGDYASTAKIQSLTGQNRRGGGDATPDLVPLVGARLVRASEPEEGERLQEGIIKELTGGEPILIRALHSDFVEVKPKFKLTISGNHKPDIRGMDDGIWRRVLLVPFDVQIPKAERDPLLGEKLWSERSGILNWLIDGLISYLEGGLAEPATVLDATREYREASDPIGQFLENCCHVSGDASDSVTSRDLVQAFNFWMDSRGEGQWKDRTISLQLKDKSRRWRSPSTGKGFTDRKSSGVMRYDGIRFTDTFSRDLPRDDQGRVDAKNGKVRLA